MTDVIDRLRIEAQREPHEPIWREAIAEIQTLRVRVEALELLHKLDKKDDMHPHSRQNNCCGSTEDRANPPAPYTDTRLGLSN